MKVKLTPYIIMMVGLAALLGAGSYVIYFVVDRVRVATNNFDFAGTIAKVQDIVSDPSTVTQNISFALNLVFLALMIIPLFWALVFGINSLKYILKITFNLFKDKEAFYVMNMRDLSIIALCFIVPYALLGFFYPMIALLVLVVCSPFIIIWVGAALHLMSMPKGSKLTLRPRGKKPPVKKEEKEEQAAEQEW